MSNRKVKTRKLSILYKITLPVSALLVILCFAMYVSSYSNIKEGMVEMGVEEAQMAAEIAVSMIDGDLMEAIRPDTESYGTDNYMDMLASLQKIKETCGIEFVYTLYSDDKTKLYYGVSNDDTAEKSTYGELFESPYSEFASIFEGNGYVQDYIDETELGNLISAYLPIRNSSGNVVGILGCDYEATNVLDRISNARIVLIQISAICIVLSIIVLVFIIGSITKSLRQVDDKIYDLVHSEGDLTQKLDIHTGDEMELIADNVNSLLEYIRGIMLNISRNCAHLNDSTQTVVKNLETANDGISGVSSTMLQMSAAMEETSASVTDVNSTIASIDSTIVSIADKAATESRDADSISQRVQEIYVNAERDRDDAVRQAKAMSKTVNEKIESSKAVTQIDALTDEILNITRQTSLLALNASIEAARAGVAGKGFAVVADEIGSLADTSSKAASQIQRVSREVVDAVNDLAKEAEQMIIFMNSTAMAGYDKLFDNSKNYQSDVENLSRIMQGFADESEKLRRDIDNIKDAASAVNIAVDESTRGLVNVTEISTTLSTNIEKINNEADINRTIAKELSDEVGKFKL